jgi:hypothetical protein
MQAGAQAERNLAASDEPVCTQTAAGLPYPQFVGALKSALRDFRRPDLLADNPLMASRLISTRDPRPAELQAFLKQTAASLFESPRDQKLRRVLDLTYFEAELKQEAAAERLGLPLSETYAKLS